MSMNLIRFWILVFTVLTVCSSVDVPGKGSTSQNFDLFFSRGLVFRLSEMSSRLLCNIEDGELVFIPSLVVTLLPVLCGFILVS